MRKKIIVVGAGIAGLSAGIYALQNGFDVTIIERHHIPGGVCTGWRRNGYLFEGAIHWLTGSSAQSLQHLYWKETGALNDSVRIFNSDPHLFLKYGDQDLFLYRDINRLQAHLLEISPTDKRVILRFCADIRRYACIKKPIGNVRGVKLRHQTKKLSLLDMLRMLPVLPSIPGHLKKSVEEYVQIFEHEGIKRLLLASMPSNLPALAMIFRLAALSTGDGGYPEGGSLALIQRMTDTFCALGGEMLLDTTVQEIVIEKDTARGVHTARRVQSARGVRVNDTQLDCDAVLVASDAMAAFDTLFAPPIRKKVLSNKWVTEMRRDMNGCFCTFAGIGVKADFSALPSSFVVNLAEPLSVADETLNFITFSHYALYDGYAPDGCTAITAILGIDDSYDWWVAARETGRYQAEKDNIKRQLENILVSRFPELQGKIAVIDIATPLTYERYAKTWRGSWMTKMTAASNIKRYPCTLKGIRGVIFAGQRILAPGGLPLAAESGRRAVQTLCKEWRVMFQNSENVL